MVDLMLKHWTYSKILGKEGCYFLMSDEIKKREQSVNNFFKKFRNLMIYDSTLYKIWMCTKLGFFPQSDDNKRMISKNHHLMQICVRFLNNDIFFSLMNFWIILHLQCIQWCWCKNWLHSVNVLQHCTL